MTEVEAAQLVVMLATAFPEGLRWQSDEQQELSRKLYRMFLADLDHQAGDAAVRRLIASWRPSHGRGWPTIAEIRELAIEARHGSATPAMMAYGALRDLRSPQPAEALDQLDPVLRAALEAMGWLREDSILRGGVPTTRWYVVAGEHEASDRAKFCELYEELSRRREANRQVGALAPKTKTRKIRPAREMSRVMAGTTRRQLPAAQENEDDADA